MLQNQNKSDDNMMSQKKDIREPAADLGDLFIMFVKRLAVFPVEESGDAHDFFLLVDNGERQDVLDEKTRVIHSLFLEDTRASKLFDVVQGGPQCV